MLAALWDLLLFATAVLAAGLACAPRGRLDPGARVSLGIVIALGLEFAIGFAGFAAGLTNRTTAVVAAALMAAVVVGRRRHAWALATDRLAWESLLAWLIFAGWSLGLLALVHSYSGGGWAVDWVEHWQRTDFFVERQPLHTQFAAIYPLTARPPLANVVLALGLECTAKSFADFQALLTLFSTLIVFPVVTLARRWAPKSNHICAWALLALMVSPFVAENATFAWTKLPTAFFVLTALVLVLAGLRDDSDTVEAGFVGLCLALGLLTHYSAAIWIIALAVSYLIARRTQWSNPNFWRTVAKGAAVFALISSIWIGWALAKFGWAGTFASNTTAGAWQAESVMQRVLVPIENILDTIVPFPLRGEPADGLIVQHSALGRVRDVAFNLYQLNLLLAFGVAGLWVLGQAASRRPERTLGGPPPLRAFWATLVSSAIVLGIVVHTPPDRWGLTHICLQPLVVLGLAWISTQLAAMTPGQRIIWAAFATVDVGCGIILHFAIQAGQLARFIAPHSTPWEYAAHLSRAALANLSDKTYFHFQFFADRTEVSSGSVGLWLALCLAGAILWLRENPARPLTRDG